MNSGKCDWAVMREKSAVKAVKRVQGEGHALEKSGRLGPVTTGGGQAMRQKEDFGAVILCLRAMYESDEHAWFGGLCVRIPRCYRQSTGCSWRVSGARAGLDEICYYKAVD